MSNQPQDTTTTTTTTASAPTSPSILNLTPHTLTVFLDDDQQTKVSYAAQGKSVRVRSRPQKHIMTLDNGIKVYTPPAFEQETLDGFPYHQDEEEYHPDLAVSMIVGEHVPSGYRGNVYCPDTGPQSVVRDSSGRILGVKRLCLVHKGRKDDDA